MSRPNESKRARAGTRTERPAGVAGAQLSTGLYLVATPIGNARDITLRAMDVLREADVIACEDTRQTRKLMDIHGIPLGGRRMLSYHDQNGAARRPQIMALLAEGASVAYATDAGTPMIADPGYKLVEAARTADIPVHAVPGASAILAALVTAGLPTDRFLFGGFLPVKSGARRAALTDLAGLKATLVFYEAPRRLAGCLEDLTRVLGTGRPAVVLRELTKRFEEVRAGSLGDLSGHYAETDPPKGEAVLVVGPPGENADTADLDAILLEALETMSPSEAARSVAADLGLPRRQVYARAQALK